ncbi:MAG TPA: outer membrane protein transport protein [Burkholderiales bacterium]|nr:outer membrane protein transport protein [Burkholderiales bacterium]
MMSALAGWAGVAAASSFQLMEQNASGLGNAYAGQAAAAENASTIFYNPAGMAQLPGTQVSFALSGIGTSIQFTDSGASRSPAPGLIPLGGDGSDAGSWSALPTGYLSWQVNNSVWLGLGITSPFGLKTEYDANFIGRFQSQTAELKTYDINPGIAWKINDTVTVGAGVSYQHAKFALDRSAVTAFVPPATVFTGSTHLDTSDSDWGWNVGAMFNFGPATRVGVSYRSSIGYDLSGTATTGGVPLVGTIAPPVTASIRFPDTYSVGFTHAFNDEWELLGDFTYTRWSTIKNVPIVTTATSGFGPAGTTLDTFNFQFDDSFRIGLGVNDKISKDFTLKAGIAYDQSPVDDQYRLVALPDNNRTWLALGGKYALSKSTTVDFGYAHLFVKDASISQTRAAQGAVIGTYSDHVDIVSAQLTFSF